MSAHSWYPRAETTLALLAAAAFVGYFGLHCFRSPWIGDIHRHTAAVASLYTDLLRPPHEAMPVTGSASEVHTPYIVGVAAAGRLLGITPYRALQWAGVFNLVLYLLAVSLFFRTFSVAPRSWLPPLAFLTISLFLRDRTFLWASETSATTLRYIQAYPSLIGWSVALVSFSAVEAHLRRPRALLLVIVALLVWFLLLSHNLTAGWVIGIIGCRMLVQLAGAGDTAARRRVVSPLAIGAAAACGVVMTWLWPYFDITASPALRYYPEGSEFADHPFRDMGRMYVLAFPASLIFLWHRRHGLLAGGFAVSFAALQVFRALDYSYGNRFAFFQAFFAQAVLADAVAVGVLLVIGQARRMSLDVPRTGAWRVAFPVVAGAALALTITTPLFRAEAAQGRPLAGVGHLMAAPSYHDIYYSSLGGPEAQFTADDIVLVAPGALAFDIASITGASVVVSPFAYRVADYAKRAEDVERFLTVETSAADRADILRRYHVSKILVTEPHMAIVNELSPHGTVIYSDAASMVFAVTSAETRHSREQRSPLP